ncbi:MAG: hypothetical protein SGJ01_15660 [Gemmatimonadota bacterium]|nr:hypothetical protein [Gemmatimonadota bacterium]
MNENVIAVFGMLTGVITSGLFFWCIVQVARSEIGQALARRIQGRHGSMDSELLGEVGALRDQVEYFSQQLTETQERVEFTERLLSRGRVESSGEA